ncbi:hypothetical protein KUL72_04370 [Bradyrhizobium arachidis]|uniref:hypothetical protein n=1 Tax=Bradyrhizobium arachidis TaxID=858423 RepID=UPI002162CB90|nr:hypothetical protein [Bradyrhizobium arachidis]UVO37632.1 hypothetical protein KUL72_04370 [Bradyrhizobium arachidis]
MTGIALERNCATVSYVLHDQSTWPRGSAGGISRQCEIELLAEFALQRTGAVGPHEVHEALHQFQLAHRALRKITVFHPLFAISMLEVEQAIGDNVAYDLGLARMRREADALLSPSEIESLKDKDNCKLAQTWAEEKLYMKDHSMLYRIYRGLKHLDHRNAFDKLSRILNDLSEGATQSILLKHRCIL